jgi:hypothetical protein
MIYTSDDHRQGSGNPQIQSLGSLDGLQTLTCCIWTKIKGMEKIKSEISLPAINWNGKLRQLQFNPNLILLLGYADLLCQ